MVQAYIKSLVLLVLVCMSISMQAQIQSIEDPRLERAYALYLNGQAGELDEYLLTFSSESDYYHFFKGVVYSRKDLFDAASEEFEEIQEGFELEDLVKLNLGNNAVSQKKYADAVELFEQIKDSKVLNETQRIDVINNLGISYWNLKQRDLAEEYAQRYIDLIDDQNKGKKAIAMSNLANYYYEQYKDSLAIPLFKAAHEMALESDNLLAKQNTALNMAVVEKNRSDYKKSIDYYMEYNRWKDSIWNRDKIYDQLNAEKELAVEVKEAEIRYQKQTKTFFIILALLALGMGSGMFVLYRKTKRLNKDLHLIYSVLSHDLRTQARSLLSPGGEQQKAQALNHSLNNILFWTMDQSDQLLIQAAKHPLQILVNSVLLDFQDRFDERSIKVELSGDLKAKANFDMESLKIILRNLFDNAIKYAPTGGKVHLELSANQLIYSNSGMAFSVDQKTFLESGTKEDFIDRKRGIGMGMSIIKKMANKNGIKLHVIKLESGDSGLEMNFN